MRLILSKVSSDIDEQRRGIRMGKIYSVVIFIPSPAEEEKRQAVWKEKIKIKLEDKQAKWGKHYRRTSGARRELSLLRRISARGRLTIKTEN